jgi:hypothetical protein
MRILWIAMRLNLVLISLNIFFAFLCGYLLWSWTICLKSTKRARLGWRELLFFAGLCCATITTMLAVFIYVHARITGGYPFYDLVELFCIRCGGLTALLGMMFASAGKGRPQISVAIISGLCLLIWLADAMSQ